MNKITFTIICLSFIINNSFSQSFEATTMPGITTTPSDSRSAIFVDIDGDGWDDIFITNSAGPGSGADNFLYINNTDGTFTTITNDVIVVLCSLLINIDIIVPNDFPDIYKNALVKTARLCAVKKHLDNPPRIDISSRNGDSGASVLVNL